MHTRRLAVGLLAWITLAAADPAAAAVRVAAEGRALLPGVAALTVQSDSTGGVYEIEVTPPFLAVALPGQRFPVVYALDGGYGLVGQNARLLGAVTSMEPAYVISIAYPADRQQDRDRDMLHRASQRGDASIGGGGAAFQAFLLNELRPLIEARFPVDPARSVLFGHSLSALFTATLMSERPEAFAAYILASPSANYDFGLVDRVAAAAPRGGGRTVFLTVGGAEGERMQQQVQGLFAALSSPASTFRAAFRSFEGEGHLNYYPYLVPVALRHVLPRTLPTPVQQPVAVDPAGLKRFVGLYRFSDGKTYRVGLDGAGLTGELSGMPSARLTPEAPNRFFVRGSEILVTFDDTAVPAKDLKLRIYGFEASAMRQGL